MFAEAAGDSVIDVGTIYYYPRPSIMTSNQVAQVSMNSLLGAANFSAGWGDTVSMGATSHVRNWLNIQSVDRTSIAYGAGELAGMANEAGLAIGGGLRGAEVLKANRYLRIGWSKHGGRRVFRIAGDWVGKFKENPHIDIFKGPRY